MTLLVASNTCQNLMTASFTVAVGDTMLDTGGTLRTFNGSDTSARTFEVIKLPPNSRVVSGSVDCTVAFDAATLTSTIGDSGSATRYLGSTDLKGVGTTPLVPTGYVNTGGLSIRLVTAIADAITTGSMVITVNYVIEGRSNEVIRSINP